MTGKKVSYVRIDTSHFKTDDGSSIEIYPLADTRPGNYPINNSLSRQIDNLICTQKIPDLFLFDKKPEKYPIRHQPPYCSGTIIVPAQTGTAGSRPRSRSRTTAVSRCPARS